MLLQMQGAIASVNCPLPTVNVFGYSAVLNTINMVQRVWDVLGLAETGWKDKVRWEEHDIQGIVVGREYWGKKGRVVNIIGKKLRTKKLKKYL